MDCITIGEKESCTEWGFVYELNSLYAYLERITDPRKPKGIRYQLASLLLLILLAKMGGENHPTGITEWIKHREEGLVKLLKLPRKEVPHHCTIRRILQILDPEVFEKVIGEYQRSKIPKGTEIVISIDGKSLRGTIAGHETRGEHLLAAYLPGSGLVLMQVAVDRKENEITAAPTLLESIDLNGAIVIGDAMHTQRNISIDIVESGGDFIWTVKGNQARSEWAIKKLFANEMANVKQGKPLSKQFRQGAVETNKRHGRIEKRSIIVSQSLNAYLDWPHVAQVFRLEREVRYDQGKRKTTQIVYGLTSLSPEQAGPKRLIKLLRKYWGIENELHYRRDVTLGEDATRTTVGNTGHNLAIINNLVVSLSLMNGHKNLAKARRLFDAKPDMALAYIVHP
jgi:predicted transposase YbfD/YdcC